MSGGGGGWDRSLTAAAPLQRFTVLGAKIEAAEKRAEEAEAANKKVSQAIAPAVYCQC